MIDKLWRKFQSTMLLAAALSFGDPALAEKPLLIGVAGPAVNLIYAYLAQDAGLWQKYGLNGRVALFESGSTLAQVARAEEISFAINSGPTTIASRTQGADTIIVAAAKGITAWSQLSGKKIGISRFGSGTDTAIRAALRSRLISCCASPRFFDRFESRSLSPILIGAA